LKSKVLVGTGLLALIVLSGCGSDDPASPTWAGGAAASSAAAAAPSPTSAAPSSRAATPSRTTRPPTPRGGSKPPKTPTDIVRTSGWIEGIVTRGGDGPCYGMIAFDGVEYALYTDDGDRLEKEDHIRVRVTPNRLRIQCGAGEQVAVQAMEHVTG